MGYVFSQTWHRNKLAGLGFSDPRGTCSDVSSGETRCFRARESSAASRNGCRPTSESCQVSGEGGTLYCCPQFGNVRAPTHSQAESGVVDQAVNAMKGILGFGVGVSATTPAGQQPASAEKPNSSGFANYAKDVARSEGAGVEEEIMGPVEDSPAGPDNTGGMSWAQRYSTHITIISTAIGLVSLGIWIAFRKKSK